MKLYPFLLFLSGVVLTKLQVVRHEYILIKTPMTWADAYNYCNKSSKTLATLQTAEDWSRLTAAAERYGLTVTGWVGLHRPNYWFFTAYGPPMNISGFHWAPGEPDNLNGIEGCVAMYSNGTWGDYICSELKPCICYNDTFGGFIAYPLLRSWWGSQVYCQTYHTALASPKNITQNEEIQQLVLFQGTSWIGISRSAWTWTAGPVLPGTPWRPGYPNNADKNNNCGFVNNSLLEDKLCNNQYYFFCQMPYTVRQQVLKLKIQGNINVSDPTSRAAVLQQIKQKLTVHGMTTEINLTWKVQPDGNIFNKKSGNGP